MSPANLGAVRPLFLAAAVLALLSLPLSAQVVERGRTFDDLTATHPCAAEYTDRIARVTDCDAADDVGDGGGAFQCWVTCDGSAPWATLAIGGGGGLPGADEVTESMLKATNAATDEYVLTYESTVGDFEWQAAATGTIGGTLTGTDNLPICTDGTGGSTIAACTVAEFPSGTAAAPSITFTGDPDTGFYREAANAINVSIAGSEKIKIDVNNFYVGRTGAAWGLVGMGITIQGGFKLGITASTAGSGAPATMDVATQLGHLFTNEGSTAANYRTLPTAVAGYSARHCVQDADGMRIVANTSDTIRVIDKVTAAAGYIESTTIGSCVTLVALNATEWFAESIHGEWSDGTWTYSDLANTTP